MLYPTFLSPCFIAKGKVKEKAILVVVHCFLGNCKLAAVFIVNWLFHLQ